MTVRASKILKNMNNNSRTTIKTVAADAGVSVSAVSKVLRNAYGVSDSLREKVETSITKLGYRPNTAARAMRGSTYTIGVVVSDLRNPFVPDLIDGIREAADAAQYRIMIGVGRADRLNERDLANTMLDQQMDGLILIGPRMSPTEIGKFATQIPVTCLAYHAAHTSKFDTVNADDAAGAQTAVDHLIAAGHRHISMVTIDTPTRPETHVYAHREKGYRASMMAAGYGDYVDVHRLTDPIHRKNDWAQEFLMGFPRPTAVFCWSDLDAIGLMTAAQKMGLNLPGDLSIVGFDNSSTGALLQIGLTSIDQNGFELGRRAAQSLFSRIDGRASPIHLAIQTKLVTRKSVALI